jgi:hypothetical protein
MANTKMIEQSEPLAEEERNLLFKEIMSKVQFLTHEDRLRLIRQITEEWSSTQPPVVHRQLVYGEFKGDRETTEEDFKLAEWHPDESEWDG